MTDLTRIATDDLRALRTALDGDRLPTPLTAHRLATSGLAVDRQAVLDACAHLDATALRAVLDATLAERDRPRHAIELVWTGPEPTHATTRDTRRALDHLFRAARHEVLLVGFSFDHGARLFAPLHHAMRTRGVTARFIIDVPGDQRLTSPLDEAPATAAHVATFLHKNWPWPLRPSFHYDPRRFDPTVYASIHAKCVVTDARLAFVTSANFTDRGHTRNVEVGALIDDPRFAADLAGQLHRCLSTGVFRQVPTAALPPTPDPPDVAPPEDAEQPG